jgi:hypothetical protein
MHHCFTSSSSMLDPLVEPCLHDQGPPCQNWPSHSLHRTLLIYVLVKISTSSNKDVILVHTPQCFNPSALTTVTRVDRDPSIVTVSDSCPGPPISGSLPSIVTTQEPFPTRAAISFGNERHQAFKLHLKPGTCTVRHHMLVAFAHP